MGNILDRFITARPNPSVISTWKEKRNIHTFYLRPESSFKVRRGCCSYFVAAQGNAKISVTDIFAFFVFRQHVKIRTRQTRSIRTKTFTVPVRRQISHLSLRWHPINRRQSLSSQKPSSFLATSNECRIRRGGNPVGCLVNTSARRLALHTFHRNHPRTPLKTNWVGERTRYQYLRFPSKPEKHAPVLISSLDQFLVHSRFFQLSSRPPMVVFHAYIVAVADGSNTTSINWLFTSFHYNPRRTIRRFGEIPTFTFGLC